MQLVLPWYYWIQTNCDNTAWHRTKYSMQAYLEFNQHRIDNNYYNSYWVKLNQHPDPSCNSSLVHLGRSGKVQHIWLLEPEPDSVRPHIILVAQFLHNMRPRRTAQALGAHGARMIRAAQNTRTACACHTHDMRMSGTRHARQGHTIAPIHPTPGPGGVGFNWPYLTN